MKRTNPVMDAAVWFGGRRMECDEKGRVLVPFSNNPGNRMMVIEDGSGFAFDGQLLPPSRELRVERRLSCRDEALRPGALATIAVRPLLTVAGRPISLTRLSDVRLVLTATDLDGITSSTTIPDFKIGSDLEATHEFRVPDRLVDLVVELKGKVKVASAGNEEIELQDWRSFPVNGQLRTERVR